MTAPTVAPAEPAQIPRGDHVTFTGACPACGLDATWVSTRVDFAESTTCHCDCAYGHYGPLGPGVVIPMPRDAA